MATFEERMAKNAEFIRQNERNKKSDLPPAPPGGYGWADEESNLRRPRFPGDEVGTTEIPPQPQSAYSQQHTSGDAGGQAYNQGAGGSSRPSDRPPNQGVSGNTEEHAYGGPEAQAASPGPASTLANDPTGEPPTASNYISGPWSNDEIAKLRVAHAAHSVSKSKGRPKTDWVRVSDGVEGRSATSCYNRVDYMIRRKEW